MCDSVECEPGFARRTGEAPSPQLRRLIGSLAVVQEQRSFVFASAAVRDSLISCNVSILCVAKYLTSA